jgi:hypothetical protein
VYQKSPSRHTLQEHGNLFTTSTRVSTKVDVRKLADESLHGTIGPKRIVILHTAEVTLQSLQKETAW